jgi:serine O-acetyltransferase
VKDGVKRGAAARAPARRDGAGSAAPAATSLPASGPSPSAPTSSSNGERPHGSPPAAAPPSPEAGDLELADAILSAAEGMREGLASDGPLPPRQDIRLIVEELIEVLFPESHRMGTDGGSLREHVARTIASLGHRLEGAVLLGLRRGGREVSARHQASCRRRARTIVRGLLDALPELRSELAHDVVAAFESDPAATGIDEVVACYPGLYAIAVYRVAHRLLLHGAEVVPRMLTEHAHSRTGIDIHPGALIGSSFFIDHGTGIVIGETTVIGNRVRIYQGVTLGALSIRDRGRTDKPHAKKRHPTIEDDVIIYANATILGGQTVIGRAAVVGGNAWITYSVPAGIRVGVGT